MRYLIPRIKKLIVFVNTHYVTRNDFLVIVIVARAGAGLEFLHFPFIPGSLCISRVQEVKNINQLVIVRQPPNPIIGIVGNMQRGAGWRGFNGRVDISPIIFTRAFPVPIQPQF